MVSTYFYFLSVRGWKELWPLSLWYRVICIFDCTAIIKKDISVKQSVYCPVHLQLIRDSTNVFILALLISGCFYSSVLLHPAHCLSLALPADGLSHFLQVDSNLHLPSSLSTRAIGFWVSLAFRLPVDCVWLERHHVPSTTFKMEDEPRSTFRLLTFYDLSEALITTAQATLVEQ